MLGRRGWDVRLGAGGQHQGAALQEKAGQQRAVAPQRPPGFPCQRLFFLIIYLQFFFPETKTKSVIFYTYKAQKEKTKGSEEGRGEMLGGGRGRDGKEREKSGKERGENSATIHQHSWDRNSSAQLLTYSVSAPGAPAQSACRK